MSNIKTLNFTVSILKKKVSRLDCILVILIKKYSRSYIKKLILCGKVMVNHVITLSPKKKIYNNDLISVVFLLQTINRQFRQENIFLNKVYEDSELLIINKPEDLVIYPGHGHLSGTLLNAIIYHYKENEKLPRAGIVHRLDRYTTGLIMVAKNFFSYKYLVNLLKFRKVIKEYDVIVIGQVKYNGFIELPIKRNIWCRTKMMTGSGGKEALTCYRVIAIFRHHTHLRVQIKTGRTHQIRVHLSSISYPILGDQIYSRGIQSNVNSYSAKLSDIIRNFSRPALHASRLCFKNRITNTVQNFEISPPNDLIRLINNFYAGGFF